MNSLAVDLIKGGAALLVGIIDRAIARRRAKTAGDPREILEGHDFDAADAKKRAHEALRRRREAAP